MEELGYYLGLVVPPEDKYLFYRPRVTAIPPLVGYGTQIQEPEYNPNVAFVKLGIPLRFELISSDKIKDANDLLT